MTVVNAVTISSTNITGFLISVRGSSLTKAEPMAGITILGSNSAETGMRLRIILVVSIDIDATPDQFAAAEKVVPATIASCSTIGPSASAGKKVRPPTMTMTPTTRPTNRVPVVGNVPAEAGTDFLVTSEPAIAMAGTIIMKRPTNIATAPVML